MNGRVYDQNLGRFISADPFVQFPESTQGYNRYSYVGNNPLSYSDPSGYFSLRGLLGDIKDAFPTLIGLAVCAGSMGTGCAIAAGMISGAVGGYMATGTMMGAFQGAALGGISAGFANGIGAAYEAGTIGLFGKSLLHGITQGGLSAAGGGRFGDGFLGAFAGSMAGPLTKKIGGDTFAARAGRIVTAAVIGGSASRLGGGRFANGAISGAMVAAFSNMGSGADGTGGSGEGGGVLLDENGNPVVSDEVTAPYIEGGFRTSSQFGSTATRSNHMGVDMVPLNPDGSVCQMCVANSGTDGVILAVRPARGFGPHTVVVGTPGGNQVIYGHMQGIIPGIAPGVRVSAGQALGIIGNEGTSTGLHLHVEIRQGQMPFTGLRLQPPILRSPAAPAGNWWDPF